MDNRPGVSARGHYLEPVTERPMTYVVGYITRDHIPCMTLYPDPADSTTYAGEPNEPYTVPTEVLLRAIQAHSWLQRPNGTSRAQDYLDDARTVIEEA